MHWLAGAPPSMRCGAVSLWLCPEPEVPWLVADGTLHTHTRASKRCLDVVKRAQMHMIAQMLRRKRRTVAPDGPYQEGGVVETFCNFQIRINREVRNFIVAARPKLEVSKTIKIKQMTFAGHIARLGLNNREEHLVKHICLWRNSYWWKFQR